MSRLVLTNAALVEGARRRSGVTVVVEGSRIAQVGTEPFDPRDAQVFDLAGRTLLPGLVTTHFHATYEDLAAPLTPVGTEKPPGYLALRAARNFERALLEGFTGVVSAGGPFHLDAQIALAVDDGLVRGPRIVAGSHAIVTTGDPSYFHGDWWWELGNPGGYLVADGPEELRQAVRREIQRGAEMIKIFPSGGHGLVEDRRTRGLGPDELRAVVDAAHDRGKKVRAHAVWKPIVLECIAAGVDVIDHGDDLDAECIDAMAKAGTFLVPSMRFLRLFLDDLALQSGGKARALAPLRAEYENLRKWVPVASGAGVKLLLGDDYGVRLLPHRGYAEELAFYVKECGVAPAEVLRWATVNGAELVGAGGQIAKGVHADLIVVDGDPLADVGVVADAAKLLAVIKNGAFATPAASLAALERRE